MAIKYKWLAEKLREIIIHNLKNGIEKLPTEQAISKRYKVSRQTVRQALLLIENEGLIRRKQGSGYYLTGLSPEKIHNRIALVIYSDTEYIYPTLIEDIKNTLSRNGFELSIYVTNNQLSIEREILTGFLSDPPSGLIVEGCKSALPNPNIDLYQLLLGKDVKLLFLHNYYDGLSNVTYIKDDNYGGAYSLVQHFVELGHRNIGGIFHAEDRQGFERYHGFIEAMRDYHLPVLDAQVGWFRSHEYALLESKHDTTFMKQFVPTLLAHCSALIIYNDELAYWLINEFYPTKQDSFLQIAIASFDNTYLSTTDYLSLTTLAHKPHLMGETAANMMISKLKGLPVSSVEVPWSLYQKESSRKNY